MSAHRTHLVILQVALEVGNVLTRTLGHVYPFERVVLQRISRVLPLCGLRPPQTLRAPEGPLAHLVRRHREYSPSCGSFADLVGIVVRIVLFQERLRCDFTEK